MQKAASRASSATLVLFVFVWCIRPERTLMLKKNNHIFESKKQAKEPTGSKHGCYWFFEWVDLLYLKWNSSEVLSAPHWNNSSSRALFVIIRKSQSSLNVLAQTLSNIVLSSFPTFFLSLSQSLDLLSNLFKTSLFHLSFRKKYNQFNELVRLKPCSLFISSLIFKINSLNFLKI